MSALSEAKYSVEHARVAVPDGEELGAVVRHEGRIVAIVIHLSGAFYGEDRSKWYLEVGLGPCSGKAPAAFDDLSAALIWIAERCGDPPTAVADVIDARAAS